MDLCIDTALCETVAEVRAQAILPSRGSIFGRPLPLMSHWGTGKHQAGKGWTPQLQLDLIKEGRHILPTFDPKGSSSDINYFAPYEILAYLKMPITFAMSQWERKLSQEPYYSYPAEINPNVVRAEDGEILKKVSPFGLKEHWHEVGVATTTPLDTIQSIYPNPEKIIFLSNNEHSKLRWVDANTSRRFLDQYGAGTTAEQKRQIVGDSWINLYSGMLEGMVEGLTNENWKRSASFVGYEAFRRSSMGRWWGWQNYDLHIDGRKSPWPDVWDGNSPSYYTHDWNASTDYTVWSPQIQAMNWIPAIEEAQDRNPNYWFELSVWDGTWFSRREGKIEHYESQGQVYNPDRYQGYAKYGMWLTRPRVVREFRGWAEPFEKYGEYSLALSDAVEEIYDDSKLQKFWRYGELVHNPEGQHPYQNNLTDEQKEEKRWYLLDVDVNEPLNGTLMQEIKVFALALKLSPSRKERKKCVTPPKDLYLVLTFSPLASYESVIVTIPGHGDVLVSSSPKGDINIVEGS